jgi:DNA-binding transcriptional regulator YiaG
MLKEEITRLARKEIKTENLKKASSQYRTDIAALKKRTTELEKQLARLQKTAEKSGPVKADLVPGKKSNIRFTVKGFKSLRQKLELTASQAGALLGVPASSIYNWEAESAKPRTPQMEKLEKLRTMGKKEVRVILETLQKHE